MGGHFAKNEERIIESQRGSFGYIHKTERPKRKIIVLDPKIAGDIQTLLDSYITKHLVDSADEARAQALRESVIPSVSSCCPATP